jgi:hypothetical protein
MKKSKKSLIVLTGLLLAFFYSKAQTEKGSETLGLNLGLSILQSSGFNINQSDNSTSTENAKTTIFDIGPHYSYFIADNLDIGVNLSYSSTVTTYNTTATNVVNFANQNSRDYSVDIFIRKYFLHKNKIGIRAGAYLGYGYENQNQTYPPAYSANDYGSKVNSGQAGIDLDLVYFPSKRLGFAATLVNMSYEHYTENDGAQGHSSGNDFNLALISNGLSLSVFYVFGGKG